MHILKPWGIFPKPIWSLHKDYFSLHDKAGFQGKSKVTLFPFTVNKYFPMPEGRRVFPEETPWFWYHMCCLGRNKLGYHACRGPQFDGAVHHGRDVKRTVSSSYSSHGKHYQEAERKMNSPAHWSFSLYPARTPAHRMVLVTSRAGLPMIINPI